MENLVRQPLLVFVESFAGLWPASTTGSWLRGRNQSAGNNRDKDLGVILPA